MDFMMEREKYEELLSELLLPDLEQSRKTEILQELRNNYTNAYQGASELNKKNDRLQKDNDDLVVSNSKLFRQTGIMGEKEHKEEEQLNYSETVTIEQLEGSM